MSGVDQSTIRPEFRSNVECVGATVLEFSQGIVFNPDALVGAMRAYMLKGKHGRKCDDADVPLMVTVERGEGLNKRTVKLIFDSSMNLVSMNKEIA